MLVVFQFPIADVRAFTRHRSDRIPLPDWPNPEANLRPQFVRGFGRVVRRGQPPDPAWADEIAHALAHRGLRLPGLTPSKSLPNDGGIAGAQVRIACAFRRVWSDGDAVARVEVGFRVELRPRLRLGPQQLLGILVGLANLPANVGQAPAKSVDEPLIRQGPHLAARYARATTQHGAAISESKGMPLVEAGQPLIIIEHEKWRSHDEDWIPPGRAHSIPIGTQTARLTYAPLREPWGSVSCWYLWSESGVSRNLRICLLRLHAEQQVLDLVLKHLRRGTLEFRPHTDEGDYLQEYINRATRLVQRSRWAGIDQSAVLQAFDASLKAAGSVQRDNLTLRFESSRRQIWRKAEEYERWRRSLREITLNIYKQGIEIGGNVSGNVTNIVNSRVENSLNKFAETHPNPDELTRAVADLHEQVKMLAAELGKVNPDEAASVLDNLELLTEEAAKAGTATVRSGVVQSTGEWLAEASKKVAKYAIPVAAAVKAVCTILGVPIPV